MRVSLFSQHSHPKTWWILHTSENGGDGWWEERHSVPITVTCSKCVKHWFWFIFVHFFKGFIFFISYCLVQLKRIESYCGSDNSGTNMFAHLIIWRANGSLGCLTFLAFCLQHPAETLVISFLIKLITKVNNASSMLNCLFSPLYISKKWPHIGTVIITWGRCQVKWTPCVFHMCEIFFSHQQDDEAENLTSCQLLYSDHVPWHAFESKRSSANEAFPLMSILSISCSTKSSSHHTGFLV